MNYNWQRLKKIWVNGTTGQKDGKISHETLTAIDQFIFGFEKELGEKDAEGDGFIGFDKICNDCPFRKAVKEMLRDG